ncbi:ABC transporter [Streptomyces yangpuensis]|uniref:ABC transporter n=1 Tax=Streptomyces yangpuensis TaxID=1648182 RepID=UPI0036BD5723
MTALLRYQAALLLRSQRWLAPCVAYAAFVAVGIRPGDPVLDSLGYAAAGLVPFAAWLVRICAGNEPGAARDCAAAAAGPSRVHAAALLTGLVGALIAGALGAGTAFLVCDRAGAAPAAAAVAGGLVTAVCALTGAAVGALSAGPLLRRRGHGVLSAALGSLLALVLAPSPAHGAVSALATAARSGSTPLPLTSLAVALALAGAAGAAACLAAGRRG